MLRKIFLSILITDLLFSFLPKARGMAQGTSTDEEPQSGAVVCAPDVYVIAPDDCLPFGPSTYITEMAKLGLTFPQRALPAYKPDPSLTQLPYFYFKMEEDNVPVLSGPGGDDTGQYFLPGFVYVSYIDRVDTGHGIYYMLQSGGWIPGKGARVGEYSAFQGLQFRSTPPNAFAWPLPFYTGSIPVYSAPGYNAPLTEKIL